LTEIGSSAFEDCISLSSVTLPESMTGIGWSAFKNCNNLASITLPEGILWINPSTFSSCYNLASITLPESVTSIGYSAFEYCSSLKNIVLSKNLNTIGKDAFFGCSSLEIITLPESLTSIEASDFECFNSKLKLYIPESVTGFGVGGLSCSAIYCHKNSAADKWATGRGYNVIYVDDIDIEGFRQVSLPRDFRLICGATRQLVANVLPEYDHPQVSWSSDAPNVVSVVDGLLTALRPGQAVIKARVGENTASCKVTVWRLNILTLPENLTRIESEAFANLPDIDALRIPAGVTYIAEDAFAGSNIVIYAPAGSPAVRWAVEHGFTVKEE